MTCFSRIALCLPAILLALLVSAPVFADPPLRKVTVIGNAVIKVVPDEMLWTVQVSIYDSTLAKANLDRNAHAAAAYLAGMSTG